MDWYDKAVQELEEEYNDEKISYKQFKKYMRELNEDADAYYEQTPSECNHD